MKVIVVGVGERDLIAKKIAELGISGEDIEIITDPYHEIKSLHSEHPLIDHRLKIKPHQQLRLLEYKTGQDKRRERRKSKRGK